MSGPMRLSPERVREIMGDLPGLQRAANDAGDLYDALKDVQRNGYPDEFYDLEEAIDDYIGGLGSAGVIVLLAYLLNEKATQP